MLCPVVAGVARVLETVCSGPAGSGYGELRCPVFAQLFQSRWPIEWLVMKKGKRTTNNSPIRDWLWAYFWRAGWLFLDDAKVLLAGVTW